MLQARSACGAIVVRALSPVLCHPERKRGTPSNVMDHTGSLREGYPIERSPDRLRGSG
jgi:hypothetical protein